MVNRDRVVEYLPMDTHRQPRIHELRELIERGDYVVDPTRTAEAILDCVSALALAHVDGNRAPAARHERRRVCGSVRIGLRGAARWCRGMKTTPAAAHMP